ncbi:hypothetical protein [Pedobacter cryoconitis]|uniref:hypothetical protein n=1 Tax=Pedobacter cryoconitis TaxID=188932 RepID=UPI00160F7023|nr:hypothetical protein [Pedobacter cryoconitis]MBB5649151.1 hypothetical protein [Pedobacter cryoconitis]
MKNPIITLSLLFITHIIHAQTAAQLFVSDTRNISELPNYFRNVARFDFKQKEIIGLPAVNGTYTTMLTVAPWVDATGDLNHQLNFNNDGLFYRNGLNGSGWSAWSKIVLSEPSNRIVVNAGQSAIILKPAQQDHTYMEFYARTSTPDVRSAWFGYGARGTNNLQLTNEIAGGPISIITNSGNVGIDTTTPKEKLSVNGNIRAKEIKVEAENWPDYVFEPSYTPMPLSELESYVFKNKHLPGVPTAKEIEIDGIELGKLNKMLVKQQEELILHLIEQSKKIDDLMRQVKEQQIEIKEVKAGMNKNVIK